ncbi:MAG: GIY-YIG nuclease family protein [Pseudomonadota bacterium]
MMPFGWHVWRGESRRRYRFNITLTHRGLPEASGIYVFVRRRFFFFLTPLYVGKAANLRGRLVGHERWSEAWWRRGATERHILRLASETQRRRIEEDLVRGLKPVMNDVHVPRDAKDAPNDDKLSRHWKSKRSYWAEAKKAA